MFKDALACLGNLEDVAQKSLLNYNNNLSKSLLYNRSREEPVGFRLIAVKPYGKAFSPKGHEPRPPLEWKAAEQR